jgi:hypothetical protein
VDAGPQRAPLGDLKDGYDPPLETWPPPVVVVIVVVAGWMVGVAVAVGVAVVVEVSTSAVVPVDWPEYEIAASVPKPPTATRPAIVVPMVNVRSRATARLRSAGVVRLAAFMG